MDAAQQLPELDFLDEQARDRVIVTGADAQTYLQSQIAQEIRSQAVGESQWTLVLAPTGKIDVLARITRTADETFVLDTDAGFGEVLEARLNRYKIRVAADVSLSAAEIDAPSSSSEEARIEAGWPRMGFEIVTGETIPAVTGLLSVAVNFTKGCYPGQELVERMDSRGADAPQLLRVVGASETAAVGDSVSDSEGQVVGTITSISPSGKHALAYIKRGSELGSAPPHIADS